MKEKVTDEIIKKFDTINEWINKKKKSFPQIFYTSVDLRESMFKYASIDTNIFPAGFNNLPQSNLESIKEQCNSYIKTNFPECKKILLLCEDHTRNTYYLDNISNLANIIQLSGYEVIIGAFLKEHTGICKENGFITLTTASQNDITIHCLNFIKKNNKDLNIDLCILNNDLSDGKFHDLLDLNIPICPHPKLGWHNRKKSTHFETLNKLTSDMITECNLNIDTWQLTTLFTTVENININEETDRLKIATKAEQLFQQIKSKYSEHGINEKPYLVLKSNHGTYGMGVISINSTDEILNLNRKKRNKLSVGKSSIPIKSLIIQEGIPTINTINQNSAEEVIYNVNGTPISGFYRTHNKKSNKEILNATGMSFKSFETQPSQQSYILAQLANLSAQKEFTTL